MPPPASTTLKQSGQWSRPALLLLFGVRPNSPTLPWFISTRLSGVVRTNGHLFDSR